MLCAVDVLDGDTATNENPERLGGEEGESGRDDENRDEAPEERVAKLVEALVDVKGEDVAVLVLR